MTLTDVRMPVMDGLAATVELLHKVPACQVLMLTTFDDEEYVIDALRAVAGGCLLKDIPAQDLAQAAQAVQAVHKGIYQLDPSVAGKVVASLTMLQQTSEVPPSPPPMCRTDDLTNREIDVLRLIAQSATNREIAEALSAKPRMIAPKSLLP